MIEKFAKLYETDFGQVLIILDSDEDYNPAVGAWFKPEGIGVCKIGIGGFLNTEDGWRNAEKVFRTMDKENALKLVSETYEAFGIIK